MTFIDIPLLICIFVLLAIGLAGSIIPGLPGPPFAWLGMLAGHFCIATKTGWTIVIITFFIAAIVTVLDFVLQPWLTKKFGGSKAAVWGATIGLIISLILGAAAPWLIIVGPFAGAFIGEVTQTGKSGGDCLKAASGAFIGFILGTGIKIICVFAFFWIIVYELLVTSGVL